MGEEVTLWSFCSKGDMSPFFAHKNFSNFTIEGLTQSPLLDPELLFGGVGTSGGSGSIKKPRSETFKKILLSAHLDTR
jgi:hypothetical protein